MTSPNTLVDVKTAAAAPVTKPVPAADAKGSKTVIIDGVDYPKFANSKELDAALASKDGVRVCIVSPLTGNPVSITVHAAPPPDKRAAYKGHYVVYAHQGYHDPNHWALKPPQPGADDFVCYFHVPVNEKIVTIVVQSNPTSQHRWFVKVVAVNGKASVPVNRDITVEEASAVATVSGWFMFAMQKSGHVGQLMFAGNKADRLVVMAADGVPEGKLVNLRGLDEPVQGGHGHLVERLVDGSTEGGTVVYGFSDVGKEFALMEHKIKHVGNSLRKSSERLYEAFKASGGFFAKEPTMSIGSYIPPVVTFVDRVEGLLELVSHDDKLDAALYAFSGTSKAGAVENGLRYKPVFDELKTKNVDGSAAKKWRLIDYAAQCAHMRGVISQSTQFSIKSVHSGVSVKTAFSVPGVMSPAHRCFDEYAKAALATLPVGK